MGKATGFLEIHRKNAPYRPVEERLKDWNEIPLALSREEVQQQAARCMDCGIPFCHEGCPLGNVIPDFNDLVYEKRWREALDVLLATNNFPEFTGKVCPAPCEAACVLGINQDPVSIKQIEVSIIERGFEEGWIEPRPPKKRTGKRVAVIGSGPAGLACAEQLNRAGHLVTIYEKADRAGGLLIYGIPDFKMDKQILQRRLDLMTAEGIQWQLNTHVGAPGHVSIQQLRQEYDAIVLATGAEQPRDLGVPGSDLDGVHYAMPYLTQQNRRNLGLPFDEPEITAQGKTVVIIGGGDTGSDCLGTALRQGAKEVIQFEHKPAPPRSRTHRNPWPEWPVILQKSTSHEEGGRVDYSIATRAFEGADGKLERLHAVKVEVHYDEHGKRHFKELPGSDFNIETQLVLIAAGFSGPVLSGLVNELNLKLNQRGGLWVNRHKMTSLPGVFAAGDNVRGQSLVVWAIAEGRDVARGVDHYLTGKARLPMANTVEAHAS
ncbi:MAG TPA: glutamate synthase subunit beta [Chloroflexia bacterium]|nr:glutamate synthase subunit beta [Chloroflexia bacterium]